MDNFDANKDGVLTKDDLAISTKIHRLEEIISKSKTQQKMAWVALIATLLFTAVIFTPLIPDGRISLVSDIMSMFYIAMAGIISTYLGVSAWLSKEKKETT